MHVRVLHVLRPVVLLAAIAVMLAVPVIVHAADGPPPGIDPNRQIVVNPGFIQRSADPGEHLAVDVLVQNQTSGTYDFSAIRQDLAPAAGGCADQQRRAPGTVSNGSGNWIAATPSTFSIAGEHERRIRISISIPANISPGSYAASLELQAQGRGQGNIALRAEIGIPIIIDVVGTPRGKLTSSMHIRGGSWRWTAGSIYADVVVTNSGSFAENVGGEGVLDGWFGRSSARLGSALLLPGATCEKRLKISMRNAPDRLRASFRLAHTRASADGTKPDIQVTQVGRLYVIPWWSVVLVVLGAITIAARIRYRRGRHIAPDSDEDPSDW